ncbi:uncharacterized protein EMH_0003340 [Eimeria mitis]|uniref:Uncharacterized protein n=1 Tax=Eimeria mitis TaxID=44415 RepID=U6JUX4_9EIME|nr:uncharacterized protein EMH_0003340 [Eimeria mitis]CDJ29224.1 hypothetical protein EMH_0003340 [Eimeria mitis]
MPESPGNDMESILNGSLSDGRYTSGSPDSLDETSIIDEGSVLLENAGQDADKELAAEAAQTNASPKLHPLQKGQGQLLGQPSVFITTALVCFSLGTFLARFFRASQHPKSQGKHDHEKEQHTQLRQEQERESDEKGSGRGLAQQLDDMVRLQPVATQLAEAIQDPDCHYAFSEFQESLAGAKELHALVESSSLNRWDTPESVMKPVLKKGLSALSDLYEIARQHGLTMLRDTLAVHPVREFSSEELNIMKTYIGSTLAEAVQHHLSSLKLSCRAFAVNLEETEALLEGLPKLERLEDGKVVVAVAENLKFIQAAHETAKTGRQSAEELSFSAVAVTLSHIVRGQMRLYKDYRDFIEEKRAMCIDKREKLQSSPQATEAMNELDTVENLLNIGEQLLQAYRADIEEMQNAREIIPAEAIRRNAEDKGKAVKRVVDEISQLDFPLDETANEDSALDEAYEDISSRAGEDALEARRRVLEIHEEVQSRFPPNLFSSQAGEEQGQDGSLSKPRLNQAILKSVITSLQQDKENVRTAHKQAAAAADEISEGSDEGTAGRDLVAKARKAAMTAEGIAGNAEVLLLHAQLLESLESDLQVSAKLAQVGAEGTGMADITAEERQPWVAELVQKRKLQVEAVERALQTAESHSSSSDLALAAASMKNAAVEIASVVHMQQLKQAADLSVKHP